jgi:hypothetical protein
MLHVLDLFRIYYSGRPVVLTLALLIVVVGASRLVPWLNHRPTWERAATALVAIAGCVGLIAYASLAIWYALDPHFFDNAEPTILCVSWVYRMGGALYHSVDAAERYSHIYGPLAFIVHATAFAIFGPSIAVSKWLGALAGLASLALLYASISRSSSASRALVLTGAAALLLLSFRHYSFWSRPEPLQLFCATLALYAAHVRRAGVSAVLVGVACGVLWNLKFTGVLYSLPILVIVMQRFGIRLVSLAVALALLVMSAPFFSTTVSFRHYVEWIRLSGSTGLTWLLLRQNVEWTVFLCVPLFLATRLADRRPRQEGQQQQVIVALVIGTALVSIAASKPGAGPYHLIPFVPTIVYLVAQRMPRWSEVTFDDITPKAIVSYVAVLVLVVAAQTAQFTTIVAARRAVGDVDDIRRIMATHTGIIEMAYGRTEALSLARPLLTFRNNSYLIDQPAVREYELQRLELPDSTIEAVRQCRVNYWLVPKGEQPFSGLNAYPAVLAMPLYPDRLRDAFAETHALIETTEYYDVWKCVGRR